jgi:hypothetical protein
LNLQGASASAPLCVAVMKKLLIRIIIVVVILAIVGIAAIVLSLNSAIKKGVETFGPRIAKVPLTLEGVNLSLLSGSGGIKGLIIGNPEGYKTPNAISLGLASVTVAPGSLLSEKIVVKSIRIEAPQVTSAPAGTISNASRKTLKPTQAAASPTRTNLLNKNPPPRRSRARNCKWMKSSSAAARSRSAPRCSVGK